MLHASVSYLYSTDRDIFNAWTFVGGGRNRMFTAPLEDLLVTLVREFKKVKCRALHSTAAVPFILLCHRSCFGVLASKAQVVTAVIYKCCHLGRRNQSNDEERFLHHPAAVTPCQYYAQSVRNIFGLKHFWKSFGWQAPPELLTVDLTCFTFACDVIGFHLFVIL